MPRETSPAHPGNLIVEDLFNLLTSATKTPKYGQELSGTDLSNKVWFAEGKADIQKTECLYSI